MKRLEVGTPICDEDTFVKASDTRKAPRCGSGCYAKEILRHTTFPLVSKAHRLMISHFVENHSPAPPRKSELFELTG